MSIIEAPLRGVYPFAPPAPEFLYVPETTGEVYDDQLTLDGLALAATARQDAIAGDVKKAIEGFTEASTLTEADAVAHAAINSQAARLLIRVSAAAPAKAVDITIARPFLDASLTAVKQAKDSLDSPAHDLATSYLHEAVAEAILPNGQPGRGIIAATRGLSLYGRMHYESAALDSHPPVTSAMLRSAIGLCASVQFRPASEPTDSQRAAALALTNHGR